MPQEKAYELDKIAQHAWKIGAVTGYFVHYLSCLALKVPHYKSKK